MRTWKGSVSSRGTFDSLVEVAFFASFLPALPLPDGRLGFLAAPDLVGSSLNNGRLTVANPPSSGITRPFNTAK